MNAGATSVRRERDAAAWARRWMQERDLDPAWNRPACHPVDLSACRQLAQAPRGLPQVRLNQLRGACAEQRLIQRLCRRGYPVQNQLPVGRLPGQRGVLDIQPLAGPGRRLPAGLEVKYMHAVDAQGQPRALAAFERAVRRHVAQVRRHIAQLGSHPSLPPTIRLVYQIGGDVAPARFRDIARTIYAAVAAAPGVPLRATVVPATRF